MLAVRVGLEPEASGLQVRRPKPLDHAASFILTLTREIAQFRQNLEFTQAQVDELVNKTKLPLNSYKYLMRFMACKISWVIWITVYDEITFFLDGIEQSTTNETWEQTEAKIKKVIASEEQVESASTIAIERAHRVGKRIFILTDTVMLPILNEESLDEM